MSDTRPLPAKGAGICWYCGQRGPEIEFYRDFILAGLRAGWCGDCRQRYPENPSLAVGPLNGLKGARQ